MQKANSHLNEYWAKCKIEIQAIAYKYIASMANMSLLPFLHLSIDSSILDFIYLEDGDEQSTSEIGDKPPGPADELN